MLEILLGEKERVLILFHRQSFSLAIYLYAQMWELHSVLVYDHDWGFLEDFQTSACFLFVPEN